MSKPHARLKLPSLALLLIVAGCGAPPQAVAPSPPPTTRAQSPPPAPKPVPIDPALLTDKFLGELISECRRKVERDLKQENKTPFEWIVLDESAADSFRVMASRESDFDSVDKRIAEFRKGATRGPFDLNLSFPVLRITDSFSGPKREVGSKACYLGEDFKILE
jgi:hypothetical protein